MIKCPECGHQVSDKAPTCPSCGVEIAGNVVRCPQCGAVYLQDQDACPICNHPNMSRNEARSAAARSQGHKVSGNQDYAPASEKEVKDVLNDPTTKQPKGQAKKKRHWGALLFSFLMAVVICGVCYYFYYNAKDSKETEAFNYAITSEEPLVLQSFLDTYRDASASRRDSIQNRLTYLQQAARDWTDACVSQSKTALQQYIDKYPESVHKGDALNKIDSIDWSKAKSVNTEAGYDEYVKAHPNGAHVDDAEEALQELKLKTIQPEEKEMIMSLFRKFFQGINANNGEQISETVADVLSSFQGHNGATRNDVVSYMHRMWRDDVMNMNWHIQGDYQIEKQLSTDQQIEYVVQFSTKQEIVFADMRTRQYAYNVKAKVNSQGFISEFNMDRPAAN